MLRRPEHAPQGVGWALPSPRPVLIDELRCRRLRAQRRAHVSQSTVARRGGVRRPVPRITALFHRLRLVLAQVGVECGLGGGVGGVAQVVARVNRAARLPRDCVRPRVGGANGVCTIALESVLSPELSRGRPRSPEIARDHTSLPPDAADGLAARIAPVERVRLGDQPPVGDAREGSGTRRGGAGAADAPRLSSSLFWIAAAARRSTSALLVGSAARFACTGRRCLPRRCRRRSSRSRAACSSSRRRLTQAYGAVRRGQGVGVRELPADTHSQIKVVMMV